VFDLLIKYILKRIIILIPVLIGISVLLFGITRMMPGDPIRMMVDPGLRPDLYQMQYDIIYQRLGYDRSIIEQYFLWITNMFQGDFGWSTYFNRPAIDCIGEPLKNTIILNACIIVFYLIIALPVGIKMAVKRGSIFDNGWQVFSLATFSVPSFFLALSLIFVFSITLGWLPIGGMPNSSLLEGRELLIAWARTLVLPVTTLTIISLAGGIRYVRNAMIDALSQDYIRTARSKGLSEKIVIYSHAFRNALIPISTIVVGVVFSLFGGSAITESVFVYNGIGRLIVQAAIARDSAMVVSMNLIFALINVTSILVADVVYGLVDPRIKLK